MADSINFNAFKDFFRSGAAGGIILIFCVVISLIVANSPLGPLFENFLAQQVGYSNTYIQLKYPVLLWINDGLMAVFFLLVGLEIKRELVEGELSSFKQAALPVLAALGGVLVPALIYTVCNSGTSTAKGWGIPMATDIAFALGALSLLGSKVPTSLKVFLAALAIVDDLMAILVIAVFYSTEMHLEYLLYAGAVFVLLLIFNKAGVKNLFFYIVPGIFMWYFIHHSGIHATIAGVLTAMALPTTPDATVSPLEKLEHALTSPVNFVIMPVFAIANTNIAFEAGMVEGLASNVGMGIVLGLVVGKPAGIFLMSWLSVRLGLGSMPKGSNWIHIFGLGLLAGIGFTMSIFVALLSFEDPHLRNEAKFSILIASFIAGLMGYTLLSFYSQRVKKKKLVL